MSRFNRQSRAGFTLIELLVVIAIIALLLSLSTAAYQRVRITQMVRTSEGTVSKIQMGLDNQVKIIADNVRREAQNGGSPDFNTMLPFCDNDPDRTTAVLLYCRLRQYLPQTAAELAAPSFSLGGVTFTRPLAFKALAGINDPVPQNVAAAALYAALSAQTQGGNNFAADEVLSGAQMDLPIQTGGPVRVFKDGWGNPIPFVRCFQSTELDAPPFCDGKFGAGAAPGKDPFDAWAKIYGWTGGNGAAGKAAIIGLGTSSFPTFDFGHNTTVLAYSFGLNKAPDPALGTVDDIMGYKLRSIGAKGAKP